MASLRKTTNQFVAEAQKVHGDRYDYSEVEYVNTHVPVKIRCQQCGAFFLQEPSSHLAGHGCPKCNKKQTRRKLGQEEFITRARAVHGDRYDYTMTRYVDMRSDVVILCPIHGPFHQRAQSHILGHGCPLCKSDRQKERMKAAVEGHS